MPPACPEHFRRDSSRRRCGGIAGRYNHGVAVPRSGNGVSEQADSFRLLAYGEGATQQRSCAWRWTARTALRLQASTGPSRLDDGVRDGTLRPRIPPTSLRAKERRQWSPWACPRRRLLERGWNRRYRSCEIAQSAQPPDGPGPGWPLRGAACPPPRRPGVRRHDLRTPLTEHS